MKKVLTSLVATLFFVHLLYACPASQEPFVYTQPDGTKLTLRCVGDEYGSWCETLKQDIVVRNNSGYFEYATIRNNNIEASGVRVTTNSSGVVLAAPRTLASRASMANLMANQRDEVIAKIDSMNQAEEANVSKGTTTTAKRAAKKKTPLSLGHPKVLCILVDFDDQHFRRKRDDFKNMWNQEGYKFHEGGAYGSVKDFYRENSYGQMDVTATIVGPIRASMKSRNYRLTDSKKDLIGYIRVHMLVQEAINAAKDSVDFKQFDSDGDGNVDAVHVVFAGYDSSEDPIVGLIWPHQGVALSTQKGGGRTWKYIITSELAGNSGTKLASMRTICHEFGHVLGAPDFYDTDYEKSGGKYPGTGYYDVMESGGHHHNPYTKAFIYGWISPTKLVTQNIIKPLPNKVYTLRPRNKFDDVYLLVAGEELFLLENNAGQGFDSGCYEGLLVYHIHKDIEWSTPLVINKVNTKHPQKCYIVNGGDSINAMPSGTPDSYGNPANWPFGDVYYGDGKIFFTPKTKPSAVSWDGTPAVADICFIRRVGDNIQFVVNPQIVGESVLSGTQKYTIGNDTKCVPSCAKIKWTYTFTPSTSAQNLTSGTPIVIQRNGHPTVTIERGKYPVTKKWIGKKGFADVRDAGDLIGLDGKIGNNNDVVTYEYYTGTAVLKATITSGGNSYEITKTITLKNAVNAKPALVKVYDDESEENEELYTREPMPTDAYRLVYENPVMGTAHIRVEKYEEGAYVPYEGSYTLSVFSERMSVMQHSASEQPDCILDCGSLPIGVYQLVMQVDGQIVATSKMLKVY